MLNSRRFVFVLLRPQQFPFKALALSLSVMTSSSLWERAPPELGAHLNLTNPNKLSTLKKNISMDDYDYNFLCFSLFFFILKLFFDIIMNIID